MSNLCNVSNVCCGSVFCYCGSSIVKVSYKRIRDNLVAVYTCKMASLRSIVYCMLCLAVILVMVQLASAQAEATNKLDPALSLSLVTILITVLSLTIVITMCLAVGS